MAARRARRRQVPRQKKPVRTSAASSPSGRQGEPRSVETLTVAWMMSLLCTLTCQVTSLLVRAWVGGRADVGRLAALGDLLWFAALTCGLVTLLLTPLTLRLRRTTPPLPIIMAALLVGSLPWLIWLTSR